MNHLVHLIDCGEDTTDIEDFDGEDFEAEDIDAIIAINDIVIEDGEYNG